MGTMSVNDTASRRHSRAAATDPATIHLVCLARFSLTAWRTPADKLADHMDILTNDSRNYFLMQQKQFFEYLVPVHLRTFLSVAVVDMK
jgi:hypothetical protein